MPAMRGPEFVQVQPVRADPRAMTTHRRRSQSGFTLIELLAAIAILGTLSGVTVVGVGAVQEQARRSACATDADTLSTAEGAALVAGGYLSEADLVDRGLLASESTHHDVVLSGGSYQVVAVGECATAGDEVAMDDAPDAPVEIRRETADETADPTGEMTAEQEKEAEQEAARREAEALEQRSEGCGEGQIDINKADVDELLKIKHVGKRRAELIVAQRPFKSITEVRGIKEKNLRDIVDEGLVCVG